MKGKEKKKEKIVKIGDEVVVSVASFQEFNFEFPPEELWIVDVLNRPTTDALSASDRVLVFRSSGTPVIGLNVIRRAPDLKWEGDPYDRWELVKEE